MAKRISHRQRAINLINKGYSNKYIFEHFPYLSKTTVYNARWSVNKKKGLAALPKPVPVAQGTGITSSAPRAAVPLEFEIIDRPKKQSNARRNAQIARRKREREEQAEKTRKYWNTMIGAGSTALITHMIKNQPQPVAERTLWQRVKAFFGV